MNRAARLLLGRRIPVSVAALALLGLAAVVVLVIAVPRAEGRTAFQDLNVYSAEGRAAGIPGRDGEDRIGVTAVVLLPAGETESEGDSSDVRRQKSASDQVVEVGGEADVELEAERTAPNDGAGFERTDQGIVQKPPGAGSGGAQPQAISGDGRVTWAIIVLLIALAVIALDWALRRGGSSK